MNKKVSTGNIGLKSKTSSKTTKKIKSNQYLSARIGPHPVMRFF